METKIIDGSLKHKWEEYIQNNPYAIAWQRYEWYEVVKKHYDSEFFPLAVFENSDICGVLPLYRMDPIFDKNVLISVPYAVAGGIVADNQRARNALLNEAITISEKNNCNKIILKQYKQRNEYNLTTDENYYNRKLVR